MEDILASIREILAEDGEAGSDEEEAAQPPAGGGRNPPPQADATAESDSGGRSQEDIDSLFDSPSDAPATAPGPVPPPAAAPTDEPRMPPGLEAEPSPGDPSLSREAAVLDLTPAMQVRPGAVVSSPTAAASTDVLAQLAKAILDRRDMAVGAQSATLEGMVREMLRPLLKEWLDRNLPYLIERLVKREIDQMINRAERLED